MKLEPESLLANGYELLDDLNHKELIPFVKTYLNKRTGISVVYKLCNVVIAGIVVYWFIANYGVNNFKVDKGISYFSYGIFLAFVLIPIHEFIHVLAYKSQGAQKTSYDANLKKFYFMAIADRFVANKKEFLIVALAPCVVISSVLILMMFFSGTLWTLTLIRHFADTYGFFIRGFRTFELFLFS
jgi:hypothetical protein